MSLMRTTVALAFALAACNDASSTSETNQIDAQRPNDADFNLAIDSALLDPTSAQFQNVADGPVVCGEVNAKNAYGGYTGFKVFAFDRADKHLWLEDSPEGNADNQEFNNTLLKCSNFADLYQFRTQHLVQRAQETVHEMNASEH